jgi:hypothetical protein
VSCHVMSCHVMSCHVMSCHVISSCHVMSCHVMSCHVMSCHVMSWYVMYVMSCPTLYTFYHESWHLTGQVHLNRLLLRLKHVISVTHFDILILTVLSLTTRLPVTSNPRSSSSSQTAVPPFTPARASRTRARRRPCLAQSPAPTTSA